tara:strand:- start:92002 stop:93201 length:1200 start_codon:yes stop_codon:yes gene_type:complete
MKLSYNIKEAFANLFTAKLRSFLAILGILIGTGSVVALVSSGQLATENALAQFKALGTNLLAVSIYDQQGGANPSADANTANLSYQDALGLSKLPNVDKSAPYTSSFFNVSYNGQQLNASTIGITLGLTDVIKLKVLKGRFVSELDHYSMFCDIGYGLYQKIQQMGVHNPVGTQIRLGNNVFTIVGVLAHWPENSFFDQDVNNSILIPIQTSMLLSKYTDINNVAFRLAPDSDIDKVKKEITDYINTKVPGKSLFIRSAKQIIQKMQAQENTFTILLGVIGGISLLVGGIGVMNIMLVSVVERRREIGIRRAIGAKKRDIETLFLMEAIALSLFGGVLGVVFGVGTSYIIADFSHWEFSLFMTPPLIGFGVSVAIGVFFGFYPARRASKLDPIETLRSD